MKTITNRWLSLDYPDNYHAELQRADIVLTNADTKATLRIVALRSYDADTHITDKSLKSYAGGNPSTSDHTVQEIYIEDCRCYFCSLSEVRSRCVFLRGQTMIILSVEGESSDLALKIFSDTFRNLSVLNNN